MKKILSVLALSALAACASQTGRGLASEQGFAGFGGEGRSGTFGDAVTIYKRAADPQPKCPGCWNFRVVADLSKKGPGAPVGKTAVSALRFSVADACGTETDSAGTSSPLAPTVQAAWSPLYTSDAPVALNIPSPCQQDGLVSDTVHVEFLRQRCLNPMEPSCREMIVDESVAVKLSTIRNLTGYKGSDLPNKK
jgi:hypothetical protein